MTYEIYTRDTGILLGRYTDELLAKAAAAILTDMGLRVDLVAA